MNLNEIKQQLHEGIENIDDEEFLLTIKELINHNYTKSPSPILSDWQQARI